MTKVKRDLSLRIRPGTPRDMPTVLRMIRGLAKYERLTREVKATVTCLRRDGFGRRSYFQTLICWRGQTAVGYALYFFTYSTFRAEPTLYLEDLFVLPEQRGMGAGKALLAALARVAIRRRCGRMEWAVLSVNTPAIRFYRRLGASLRKEWILTRITDVPLRNLARTR
jgi:GNAT superfamily N-acetyltransferase